MGWVSEDDPAHEGYPVALVLEDAPGGWSARYREIRYPEAVELLRVHVFQVACECGWRSRRFYAPLTATYRPHSLDLGDEAAEEEACGIWRMHVASSAARAERPGRRLFPAPPP